MEVPPAPGTCIRSRLAATAGRRRERRSQMSSTTRSAITRSRSLKRRGHSKATGYPGGSRTMTRTPGATSSDERPAARQRPIVTGARISRSRKGSRACQPVAALLAAVALAGCGGSTANQAVSDAAHVAHVVTQLSKRQMRSWCPRSVADGGRALSQAEARECLRRAWNGWLSELRRDGYDPRKIAQGQ